MRSRCVGMDGIQVPVPQAAVAAGQRRGPRVGEARLVVQLRRRDDLRSLVEEVDPTRTHKAQAVTLSLDRLERERRSTGEPVYDFVVRASAELWRGFDPLYVSAGFGYTPPAVGCSRTRNVADRVRHARAVVVIVW